MAALVRFALNTSGNAISSAKFKHSGKVQRPGWPGRDHLLGIRQIGKSKWDPAFSP